MAGDLQLWEHPVACDVLDAKIRFLAPNNAQHPINACVVVYSLTHVPHVETRPFITRDLHAAGLVLSTCMG